jgi:hypothetical protein
MSNRNQQTVSNQQKTTKKQETVDAETLFRIPLSPEITELIFDFAKIHQYTDRKQYKEKWNEWIECEDIKDQIATENTRIQAHGFDGDIANKLFISARYYYRNLKETSPSEITQRKEYVSLSKDFLQSMDNWIQQYHAGKPPSQLYIEYCQENQVQLQQEIQKMRNQSSTPLVAKEIDKKFKKTFNNREYNLRKKA